VVILILVFEVNIMEYKEKLNILRSIYRQNKQIDLEEMKKSIDIFESLFLILRGYDQNFVNIVTPQIEIYSRFATNMLENMKVLTTYVNKKDLPKKIADDLYAPIQLKTIIDKEGNEIFDYIIITDEIYSKYSKIQSLIYLFYAVMGIIRKYSGSPEFYPDKLIANLGIHIVENYKSEDEKKDCETLLVKLRGFID
jgi:hypothetical protein